MRSLELRLRHVLLASNISLISIPLQLRKRMGVSKGWKRGEVEICGHGPDCGVSPVDEFGHVVMVYIKQNEGGDIGGLRLQVQEFTDEDSTCGL
jgi:hypothetical protein